MLVTPTRYVASALLAAFIAGCGGGGGGATANPPPNPPIDTGLTEPVGTDVAFVSGLKGEQLVGQSHSSRLVIVPADSRNRVIGLRISNPSTGGAPPSIDGQGVVSWVPNEIDFQGTRVLQVTVQLATGIPQQVQVPTAVRRERLILETSVPASAGTVTDASGRYLIRLDPEDPAVAMSGMLKLAEIYDASGSFRFSIRVSAGSNVVVTIVNAPDSPVPALGVATTGRGRALSLGSQEQRARPLAEVPAASLQANVGRELGFLSGAGRLANVGQVNVYTTRGTNFLYRTSNSSEDIWNSLARVNVFQIDANCTTADTCGAIRSVGVNPSLRSPVVLIHGFNLPQSVGGGDGTWGALAKALTDRGHPVFELRWNTYMRFEEAAGVLAELSRRVAEITGNKVSVIAHSFGGIVAHTAAMGLGIRHDGTQWNRVSVDGLFGRILTLGSPLSGIRYVPADVPLSLTGGGDDDDVFIKWCEAITCYQAGAPDNWDAAKINELAMKVSAIDRTRTGLPTNAEGATIRALHDAWGSNQGHSVPTTTVVSLKKRPFDDHLPDLTSSTAYNLGDGLISLLGQAVVPQDFALNPFAAPEKYDILSALGSNFLARLDLAHAANMVRELKNGREYYFALRAAHSSAQNLGVSYLIANYPEGGRVDVAGEDPADHPLVYFIRTNDSYLAAAPTPYTGLVDSPTSVVRGRAVVGGVFAPGVSLAIQIERADTGQAVTSSVATTSDATDGSFTFDAGGVLYAQLTERPIDISAYRFVLRLSDGPQAGRVLARQGLSVDVNLGDIDVSPVITGTPDVAAYSLNFGPSSVAPGGTIQVLLGVTNQGTATAGASTAVVRINQSTTSATGNNLASINVPSLGVGTSAGLPGVLVTAPTTPGIYRVWVLLDNDRTSGQSTAAEGNDVVLASGTLTVTTPGTPDLVVSSLTFGPSSVAPGGTVQVLLSVTNQGTATAAGSTAVVRINQSTSTAAGSNLASISVPSLAAGAGTGLPTAFATAPTTPGTYRVWMVLDNDRTSGQAPAAEGNDIVLASGTLTVTSPGTPDLVVGSLTFGPSSVAPGGTVQVLLSVTNQGTATAAGSTAVVRINQSTSTAAGSNLASISVPSLAAGASTGLPTAFATAPTTPGTYRVWMVLDNDRTSGQAPAAEGNDIVLASGTLTVTTPGTSDLAAYSLNFGPSSVAPGGTIQVLLGVTNQGTATAGASTAVVRINQSTTSAAGNNLASINVPSLGVGTSAGLPGVLVTAPTTPGIYRVWVLLDNDRTSGQSTAAEGNDVVLASGTLTVTTSSAPDLAVQNLTFSPTSVTAGATVQVNFSLVNQGSSTANPSTAVLRINQSSTSAAGSDLLTFNVPSMPAGATSLAAAPVAAPTTAGNYRLWVLADVGRTAGQVAASEANDTVLASGTLTVTTTGTPDLIVQNLTFTPSNPDPGASVQVNFTIANVGSGPAAASRSVVRINQSTTSAAGTNLATISATSLPPGASVSGSAVVPAPSVNGNYYLWMIADNDRTGGQTTTSEANDIVRASSTLTVNSPSAWGSPNPTFPTSRQPATSCTLPAGASPQDYVQQGGFKVYAGGCVASLTLGSSDWNSLTTVSNNSKVYDLARQFSNSFLDSFDFVAFVLDTAAPPTAFQTSNGTLEGQYYGLNTRLPTRTRRMVGAVLLTYIGSQGGMASPFKRGTILHELMHEWGNNGTVPTSNGSSLDVGSHWGFSSVGGILGGYHEPSGVQNAGTNAWIAKGSPRTCLSSATPSEVSTYCSPRSYFSTATWLELGDFPSGAIEYGPLERYVAGFMPLSSLPSITYAQSAAWLDQQNGLFSTSGFVTLTPSEIVARLGSRAPNYSTSQKDFRIAVVVLTPSAVVSSERLQDLNSVLTEFSRDGTAQWGSPSPNVIWLHNFYTATRGVASVRTGGLTSDFR